MAVQLQMSWQPSILNRKRKTTLPVGLKNIGNSCYLNSVIQCLTYTPPLANFCFNSQHSSLCNSSSESAGKKLECPFCLLEERIASSLKKDIKLDTPSRILSCLREFAGHFRCGQQEDAHEFLRHVIDACHNTCIRLKKLQEEDKRVENSEKTVVKDIFGGSLQSLVKCISCGFESYKVDEIMDISLDVLRSTSLLEAMKKFFQSELLDGQNKYKCEKCKRLVEATKQLSLLEAPNVLVIHLKRFEGISGRKIDKAVSFEEVLVLSKFMCKTSKDINPKYNLFGTIVHSGYSPESGHYYAYIKDASGHWYCCNDSYVSHSTLNEVLSEKVYILFFSRCIPEPQSPSVDLFVPNGVTHLICNGNNIRKNEDITSSPKSVKEMPVAENPYSKDISTLKVEKVHPDVHIKRPSSSQNTCSEVAYNNDNRIVNGFKKSEEMNGDDGTKNSETVKQVAGNLASLNGQSSVSVTHNHEIHNMSISNGKEDCIKEENRETTVFVEKQADNGLFVSGLVNGDLKLSGYKRKSGENKLHFPVITDVESHMKVQQFKEVLEKETCMALRSCGWVDEVYSSMYSVKRSCVQKYATNRPSNDTIKEELIAAVKEESINRIPLWLKGDLIQRLRSFYHPDGG